MLNRTIYLKGFKPLFDKRRRVVKGEHVFMDRYGIIYDILEKSDDNKVMVKRTHPPLVNPFTKPLERKIKFAKTMGTTPYIKIMPGAFYRVKKDKVVNLEIGERRKYFKTKIDRIKQKYCNTKKKTNQVS
ncbi:15926_t:CDS:1 [Dentiscutata erythropus]|uniref:15926_t:CDS:1 n=1 Tax=Dentiscutata erythropus TaxID=1348616 RepID=A0A9N9GQQ7_9GLOM|nr:15926_t:CDS:1 [Dentiscutata erythropus]